MAEGFYEEDFEEEQLLNRLQTVKDRVEYILKRYPNARNSDFYLTILYIRRFIPELARYIGYIPYEVIRKYEGLFESIRRSRQYIQNTLGLYPPTDPEVLEKRMKKEKAMRRVIAKGEL